MTPDRLHQIEELFHAVRERAPGEREALLATADSEVRREVESLLAQRGDPLLDWPVPGVPASETSTVMQVAVGVQLGPYTVQAKTPLVAGAQLGPYRIEAIVGSGGMGEVYRAWDSRLERRVAIKLVGSQLSERAEFRQRFQREARALAQLNHPNICTIHDVGPDFLVMEWIEGQTLKSKTGSAPPGLEEALEIVSQVGHGLAAAHERGILHRDIKPANVMLTSQGQVKIMDFGLAKFRGSGEEDKTETLGLTGAGVAMGTPAYMSPEQVRGEPTDQRTDIWSLAVVFYEIVTGRKPFRGDGGLTVMRSILDDQPVAPSAVRTGLPAGLDGIMAKALAKDPAARYQNAGDLLRDLQLLLEGDSPPKPTRRRLAGAVAAGILLIVSALYWGVTQRSLSGFGAPQRVRALAVLPLSNLSGDPNQEFFADGMTEELTADLAQIGALRVISRTSVTQFKGTRMLLPEIAKQLRVDAVVEGSVVRSGNRVRITAELIDASADRHLWAGTYERNLGDVLDLQNELARAIAAEIRAKLTPHEQVRLTHSHTVNPAAHEAYLRGLYFLNNETQEALLKSIGYFEEAIRLDSGYAEAYALVSIAWLRLEFMGAPFEEVHPKAAEAVSKALQIDDSLPETHEALGEIKAREWDWAGAEREIKKAIELNPGLSLTHSSYVNLLRHQGRFGESLAEAQRALSLDPLSPFTIEGLGDTYWSARQYDLAIEQYQKALELNPNQAASRNSLGWSYVFKGMYEKGIEEIQKSFGEDSSLNPELAYVYATMGNRNKALDILGRLRRRSGEVPVAAHHFALIYSGLGDKEQALAWLEKAYQEHSPMMTWLKVDPRFDRIRSDPRFQELMGRVGLL